MEALPRWTHIIDSVKVTPVLGDFLASADDPPPRGPTIVQRCGLQGLLPLTFWMDRRPIASRWFTPATYRAILASPLYHQSLSLALLGGITDGCEKWLRVEVVAVPALDE